MKLPPLPKELAAFAETQARHCALNDMVQAYGQQCREAALEEAAQVCESAITSIWDYHDDGRKQVGTTVCNNLAAGIRKIKEMK